jgi:hypothetical protein
LEGREDCWDVAAEGDAYIASEESIASAVGTGSCKGKQHEIAMKGFIFTRLRFIPSSLFFV